MIALLMEEVSLVFLHIKVFLVFPPDHKIFLFFPPDHNYSLFFPSKSQLFPIFSCRLKEQRSRLDAEHAEELEQHERRTRELKHRTEQLQEQLDCKEQEVMELRQKQQVKVPGCREERECIYPASYLSIFLSICCCVCLKGLC